MTIDPVELERLSKAATQGVWEISAYYTGTGPDEKCHGLVEVEDFPIGITDEEGATAESLSPNLEFVTTLVNAYRTGQLVPAQPSGDEVGAVAVPRKLTPEMETAGMLASEDYFIMDDITLTGLRKFYEAAIAARAALGEKP